MLSIGDFARFAGVSVRMLRHYDALGLLSPSRVDPHSGYRFYEPALLARADALVAFRSLGFSLEEVGDLLDEGRTPAELGALLHRRRDELRRRSRPTAGASARWSDGSDFWKEMPCPPSPTPRSRSRPSP